MCYKTIQYKLKSNTKTTNTSNNMPSRKQMIPLRSTQNQSHKNQMRSAENKGSIIQCAAVLKFTKKAIIAKPRNT